MEELAHIQQGLEALFAEVQAHPQSSDDMRKSYLELMTFVFNSYYIQWNTIQAAKIIQQKKFLVTPAEKAVLNIFTKNVYGEGYHIRVRNSYRTLILDSWSTFEFCLTYLCISLLDENVKIKMLSDDYNKIDKIISKYNLTEAEKKKVLKAYEKSHLTHLSVPRKYDKIYSIFSKNYSGDWNKDKTFLEFFGKYRNCIHANFIYHGTDVEYEILDIKYIFTDGEPVSHTAEADVNNMFDLAVELKNICKRLFDAIDYPGLIPYPSDKVPQPEV